MSLTSKEFGDRFDFVAVGLPGIGKEIASKGFQKMPKHLQRDMLHRMGVIAVECPHSGTTYYFSVAAPYALRKL